MRIPLSSYSITLALPAFYWPRRALYFTLWMPPIGIVHMLWLPSLPALLWAPPRTAACTRLRRLYHYPARAPYFPYLPPVMRSITITIIIIERMRISLPSYDLCLWLLITNIYAHVAEACLYGWSLTLAPCLSVLPRRLYTCAIPNYSIKPTFIALCNSMPMPMPILCL